MSENAIMKGSAHKRRRHSQNITTGSERAKEREELSLKEKNAQLIQIINAQNEAIKSKDSEIRLLRKILADNGIEV